MRKQLRHAAKRKALNGNPNVETRLDSCLRRNDETKKFYSSINCPFFIFVCLSALLNAQSYQELDPINLLLSDLKVQKLDKASVTMQPTIKQPALQKQSLTIESVPLNFAAQAKVQPQQALLDVPNTSYDVKQKLLKTDMVAFETDDDKQKIELQKIIEQINSVKFKPSEKKANSVIVIEPMTVSESNEMSVDMKEEDIEPQVIQKTKINKTLEKLLTLSKELDDPFELAEILFMDNHMKEAASFYQQALKKIKADEPKSSIDRAWILFQIGNCLKSDDAETAKKMYQQLINEYPDSTWTNLAKVQDKLIEWYQVNKPLEVSSYSN